MKKNDASVHVEVSINLTEEEKLLIPRPGEIVYVIQPYCVDDSEEENETKERNPKLVPILGYSYTKVPVKSSVLTDELDEVRVNGDFRIPLKRKFSPSDRMRTRVFVSESEAKEEYKTLMEAQIRVAKERFDKARNDYEYLVEALEEGNH